VPGKTPSQTSLSSDATLKAWRTKQKQLADYLAKMKRAPQRTLDEWLPKED